MLAVEDLSVSYGAVRALQGVTLKAAQGEITAIIGANGAGKSTLLNAISRVVPSRGKILLEGEELPARPHLAVRKGVVQVPEGRGVFSNMSVLENLMMGAILRYDQEVERDLREVYELFPRLLERMEQPAGTLSGGEQQMLAIGRGMMARPRVLLLDEPSLGLAPLMVQTMFAAIRLINKRGVSVLLVEQNAKQALGIAHRAYVLETGRVVLEGTGAQLLANPAVQEAYLGARTV